MSARKKDPQETTPEPEEDPRSVYEREQDAALVEFREEEALPLGLHHGLWGGLRHYICDFCEGEIGYLSLSAAEDHLARHPQELQRLRDDYAVQEMSEPEAPQQLETTTEEDTET